MIWVFIVVVAVLVIAAFLALLAGRLPYEPMSEPAHSTPTLELPDDAGPAEIAAVRFDTALRGYRMDQVDDALKVLQKRVTVLEAQVAHLEGWSVQPAHSDPATPQQSPASDD